MTDENDCDDNEEKIQSLIDINQLQDPPEYPVIKAKQYILSILCILDV